MKLFPFFWYKILYIEQAARLDLNAKFMRILGTHKLFVHAQQ